MHHCAARALGRISNYLLLATTYSKRCCWVCEICSCTSPVLCLTAPGCFYAQKLLSQHLPGVRFSPGPVEQSLQDFGTDCCTSSHTQATHYVHKASCTASVVCYALCCSMQCSSCVWVCCRSHFRAPSDNAVPHAACWGAGGGLHPGQMG